MPPPDQLMHADITEKIIGAAMRVHSALGPGLLESAYEACLAHELTKAGLNIKRQVEVPVIYDGAHLDCGFRIDILVADCVVIELKAVDRLDPVHEAQLITYLKLSGKRVGLIINFHVASLKNGIVRRVV